MQKLVLPSNIFPSLNSVLDLAKGHWAGYYKLQQKLVMTVKSYAKQQCKPVRDYPVKLEFIWYCDSRRRDPDNIASAKKFIIDGLVQAGILKKDGWKQIKGFVDKFEYDKINPRVEIWIKK